MAGPSPARRILALPLRRLLRRDPDTIARRAAAFSITRPGDRDRVRRLGAAFIAGYNAMLDAASLPEVAVRGASVAPHERPFFFEGAAMGYLPRGFLDGVSTPRRAAADLLAMHPAYLYLYYVGLGFWHGMRHPRRPETIERLAAHLDPVLLPLCYDGFGFKLGFYDDPARPAARRVLGRCPPGRRAAAMQGLGRSLFFVHMDDAAAFARECDAAGGRDRLDLEFGRSLALAFTGIDRPDRIAAHVAAAGDAPLRRARLTGATWALTARAMTDPDYFAACAGNAAADWAPVTKALPSLCQRALGESTTYAEWQERTGDAAIAAWESRGAPGR